MLFKGLGLTALIYGIYVLGSNIHFATLKFGIAASGAITSLVAGVLMLVYLPSEQRNWGWVAIAFGIVTVFYFSRAFLQPTSLWQFLVAFTMIAAGGKMLSTGRPPL